MIIFLLKKSSIRFCKCWCQNVPLDALSRVRIVSGREKSKRTELWRFFSGQSINQSTPPCSCEWIANTGQVNDWLINLSVSTPMIINFLCDLIKRRKHWVEFLVFKLTRCETFGRVLIHSVINQSIDQSTVHAADTNRLHTHMNGESRLIDWLTGNKNVHRSVRFDFSGRKLFLLYSGRWEE